MIYKRLGNSGLSVSRICLGMMTYGDPTSRAWSLPLEESDPFVKRAIEAGINLIPPTPTARVRAK
jgi:1-deoxyxylulose-5-phosphate synthase